jgi:hypothetical protein
MGKDSQEPRAKAGASTNPQDGERRVETLLKQLSAIASALRREERMGNVTSFNLGVVRADGVISSHSSEDLELWDREELLNLYAEANCGKWSIKKGGEEEIQQSREQYPSYAAALGLLNAVDMRGLLREMEFDAVRKVCSEKKHVPPHMSDILEKKNLLHFDLGEGTVSEEENDGKNSKTDDGSVERIEDDSDDDDTVPQPKRRNRHDVHGAHGKFVQSHGDLGKDLMSFSSWEEIGEDSDAIDAKRYVSLETLLDLKKTKISNLTRSLASIALRFLLEFHVEGAFVKLSYANI